MFFHWPTLQKNKQINLCQDLRKNLPHIHMKGALCHANSNLSLSINFNSVIPIFFSPKNITVEVPLIKEKSMRKLYILKNEQNRISFLVMYALIELNDSFNKLSCLKTIAHAHFKTSQTLLVHSSQVKDSLVFFIYSLCNSQRQLI